MMRFKKGSKVEVMKKEEEEVPVSWRVAEIISGNGRTYYVRYESYSMLEREAVAERVSRKVIRPCPPSVSGVKNWKAGDVVEVFVDDSWKIATILSLLGENLYYVRPHGNIRKYMVNNGDIRMQQSWEDGKWILIGTDRLPIRNYVGLPEPHIFSSSTPKRVSPYSSSLLDPYAQKAKKFRANAKERTSQQVPARLLEKVDAVVYPRYTLGEKYMQPSSFNIFSNGYHGTDRRKSNEPEIDACSVGSCSVVSESANRFSHYPILVTRQGMDNLCSDAESFNCSREEEQICSVSLKDNPEASIHRLELHAHRSTLEALYSSGPLSWEKEALLTNLRISLHISNDEHLIEGHNWRHESCFQRSKDDSVLPFFVRKTVGRPALISILLKEVKPSFKKAAIITCTDKEEYIQRLTEMEIIDENKVSHYFLSPQI